MTTQPPTLSNDLLGHNARGAVLNIEARFFNSLAKYSGVDGVSRKLELSAGVTVGDIIRMFALPLGDIYLVLRNGRDITPGLYQGGVVNQDVALDDGDVIAFSGPVPYSYGYGAPVV
ncbi:MAG: MoaD/ThiS family protein [Hyphomicrobiaceae bacterium]